MRPVKRWWRWLAAVAGTVLAVWLMPAVAWAQSGPGPALAGDALVRPRRSPSGLLGGCCCLIVVLVVVLIVMQFRRRRQPPPPPPPQ